MKRPIWRFLNTGMNNGAWNMAVDEVLFCEPHIPRPVLRFYGWEVGTLSLGYFQKISDFEPDPIQTMDLPVVRRMTGGGAILHDDELTYSLVVERGQVSTDFRSETLYHTFHEIIAGALGKLGIEAEERGDASLTSDVGPEKYCFAKSVAIDVAADSAKIAGSAQRRHGSRLMMHGSIFLGPNRLVPASASASAVAGRVVTYEEFADAMLVCASEVLDVEFQGSEPNPNEIAQTVKLSEEKYSADSWTRKR